LLKVGQELAFNMSHHIGMFPIMIIKPKNGAIFHEEVCQVPNVEQLGLLPYV